MKRKRGREGGRKRERETEIERESVQNQIKEFYLRRKR
jgi:hypothetical protein